MALWYTDVIINPICHLWPGYVSRYLGWGIHHSLNLLSTLDVGTSDDQFGLPGFYLPTGPIDILHDFY